MRTDRIAAGATAVVLLRGATACNDDAAEEMDGSDDMPDDGSEDDMEDMEGEDG